MIVLGVETSTARSSVALLVDGVCVAHEHHVDARGHGAFLAPAMQRCLDAAPRQAGAACVDAVAVGTGPGLYTGLRVGMATASAFASARGIPIVGVGGLDALALVAPIEDGSVVTTLDARRGQVFWSVHTVGEAGPARVDGPTVGTAEELAAVVEARRFDGPVLVVGEVAVDAVTRPDATDTARLALARLAAQPDEDHEPASLDVSYLRDADVRIGWAERGGGR